MSAIARYFGAMGKEVAGYDRTPSPLTDRLMDEGIPVFFDDEEDSIPPHFLETPEQLMVIYTPAIPADSVLMENVRALGLDLYKRSEVLGMITANGINLSVAGTHGKTTTSCMLAAIFQKSDLGFTAFLGGISADLGSNYFHRTGDGPAFSITEADEFDRSFLQLNPSMAAITSTDADHLDIYGEHEQVREAFQAFAERVMEPMQLFIAKNKAQLSIGRTYAIEDPEADFSARIEQEDLHGTRFSIYERGTCVLEDVYVALPGKHNLENAVAAALLALHAGVGTEHIRDGLARFKGIKRRFETIVEQEDRVFIDDYAHHPSELAAIIGSVRQLYPGRRVIAVFQPHLYSRTHDFADGFAEVLDQADDVLLLPIYPAREEPMEGVSSAMIQERMTKARVQLVSKEELMERIHPGPQTVLLTLGAGDIDRLVQPIRSLYNG